MNNSPTFLPDETISDGAVVWVTGGAGYLGSGVVAALDARGVKTICLDLPGKAEALIAARGLKHTVPIAADLNDLVAQTRTCQALIAEHGVPDAVAHLTFASSSGKTLEEITPAEFGRTLESALTPTFALIRQVGEAMAQRGRGSVVLYSSMYGLVVPDPRIYRAPMRPNPIDYGASKAALVQMTRYFAMHYGRRNVRFNAVAPGPFPNPRIQEQMPEFISSLSERTMLGRIGHPDEVVGPTLFLLGSSASYVTGHCLTVDGGWTVW